MVADKLETKGREREDNVSSKSRFVHIQYLLSVFLWLSLLQVLFPSPFLSLTLMFAAVVELILNPIWT